MRAREREIEAGLIEFYIQHHNLVRVGGGCNVG